MTILTRRRIKIARNLTEEPTLSVLHDSGLLFDEELHSLLLEGLAAVVIRVHAAAELEPLGQEVVELPGLLSPGI